jgi:hypothetical protein
MENITSLVIVRHPLERLVSFYHSKQACDGLDLKDLKFQSSSLILGLDLELNPFQNFGFGTENPSLAGKAGNVNIFFFFRPEEFLQFILYALGKTTLPPRKKRRVRFENC